MRLPILFALVSFGLSVSSALAQDALLNVSYDPTREYYRAYNEIFKKRYAESHGGKVVNVDQIHGGSRKQAQSVIDGVQADVVTLAVPYDVDILADKGLLPEDWKHKLPNNSSPYTSTIDFLVRKGNPKGIKDWGDLIKPGVKVITPDPRTSGVARWNYLAAWAWASKKFDGNEAKIKDFLKALYANVPVLDSGARGATNTFVVNGIGDVLINWENESHLAVKQAPNLFEIVTPSLSILAEPPVAVVESVTSKKGTTELAREYLQFLYSPAGQELAAQWFYRPRDRAILDKVLATGVFADVSMVSVDRNFGGWRKATKTHFEPGGTFSEVYAK